MCVEIQHVPSGKRAQICLYAASLCEGSKQPICMSQDLRLSVRTVAVIKNRKEEAKSLVGELQLVVWCCYARSRANAQQYCCAQCIACQRSRAACTSSQQSCTMAIVPCEIARVCAQASTCCCACRQCAHA
eukprot:7949-Heterococcus_DN1.PRE.6